MLTKLIYAMYTIPKITKKRTVKEETRYYLQCQGYDATDQEIQRAIWRERKRPPGIVNGWSIHSYLMHNKIAKRVSKNAVVASDQSIF
ncbi:hypothetical protein CRP01_35220 [Flavilitoribacter nigricans DSM 23189 = NBRC 102662]|uniref:Uncharacterized protein n=1 Tax=Flavilitoribacter nigricans (strain ATCC 23147 / DSM 23189 / NBRC 102662 / NCIMB 1420 / SS-2) TaxID=1122177 RepID=A0A2D0N185_FLAN2|nr:hypothetical protein CRP01_35220 [Flavilitoribacter nigricans DSM 23189 = NBRC 102662]